MTPSEIAKARDSRALSDIARRHGVKLYRMGRGWKGLCPFHNEKTPSFHVSDDRNTFKCFGCGAWGDPIDFLMQMLNLSFVEAVKALDPSAREFTGDSIKYMPKLTGERHEDENRRIKYAHELWLKREPITLTLADAYLEITRGISPETIPALLGYTHAYCSLTKRPEPAMIAPLQDSEGHISAVQLVYLDRTSHDALRDEKGRRLKRTYGCMRDGAVRLALHTTVLGLAGSVEDSLSVIQRYSIPCWAVCGEMRLARAWVPADVETVMIFGDADESGRRFAEEAREHHRRKHRVEVVFPHQGKDFNEEIRGG